MGEHAGAAWKNSVHAKKVDVALNVINRTITRCRRPTSVHKVQVISGTALLNIRRHMAARGEKIKQESDMRYLLCGGSLTESILESRKDLKKTEKNN